MCMDIHGLVVDHFHTYGYLHMSSPTVHTRRISAQHMNSALARIQMPIYQNHAINIPVGWLSNAWSLAYSDCSLSQTAIAFLEHAMCTSVLTIIQHCSRILDAQSTNPGVLCKISVRIINQTRSAQARIGHL